MLIERAREVAAVRRALGAARDGRGALVTVSGPFGSGRSALLSELARHTHPGDALVLRAGGTRSERDVPFGVVRQLLHAAGAAITPGQDSSLESEARRLRDVLLGLAGERPVLLMFDDLRWIDAASLRWLELIGGELAGAPVVIVVVSPHAADPVAGVPPLRDFLARATVDIELAPLSRAGVATMTRNFLGEVPDELISACAELSGGRPLFLVATLRQLRRSGRLGSPSEVRALRPAAIGSHAVRLLHELPEAACEMAKALAVAGPQADPVLLCSLAELSDAEGAAALGVLVSAGLLTPGPQSGFAHEAIIDAVVDGLDAVAGGRWHAKAAHALHLAGRAPEEVAKHVLAAGDPAGDWEIAVLRAAARFELTAGNRGPARKYLVRALLSSAENGPARAELLVELARVELPSTPVSSMRHLIEALPGLTSPAQRARELARLPVLACEVPPPGLTLQLAEAVAVLGDPAQLVGEERESALALEVRLRHACLGQPEWLTDTVNAFQLEGANASLATAAGRDRAATLLYAGMLAGKDSGAVAALARKVVYAKPPLVGDLSTAVPLAARALVAVDLFEQADAWLSALTVLARQRSGDRSADALIVDAERSYALARRGRHTLAALVAARTLDNVEPEFTAATARCCETLVLVLSEGAATSVAAAALKKYRSRHNALLAPWLGHLVDGALLAVGEEWAEALDHILDAGREHELKGWKNPAVLPWRSWAGLLQHRLERPDLARELVAQEYDQALAWGASSVIERARVAWSIVTDGESPALPSVGSSSGFGRSVPTQRAARTWTFAAADEVPAEAALDPLADPASPGTEELTPAEHRIARLVVAGQANQRIASELGISLRTVEKHLTKVYRKLGVDGRAGLTEFTLPGSVYLSRAAGLTPPDKG